MTRRSGPERRGLAAPPRAARHGRRIQALPWDGRPSSLRKVGPRAPLGYFTIRASLAKAVSKAARHIGRKGVAQEGAPAIVKLIAQVASRFGVTVSEKLAAQAIPMVGAVGGALINSLFIDHFQDIARGHFTKRRLKRVYDSELIKQAYDKI
jgi:hypothetical protein